jgi:hypothetical protein
LVNEKGIQLESYRVIQLENNSLIKLTH